MRDDIARDYTNIPDAFDDDFIARRLKGSDYLVYKVLLSARADRFDSARCDMRYLVDEVGRTPRTIRKSLDRLIATAWIVQRPDPDEPTSRTDWQFFFNPIQVAVDRLEAAERTDL